MIISRYWIWICHVWMDINSKPGTFASGYNLHLNATVPTVIICSMLQAIGEMYMARFVGVYRRVAFETKHLTPPHPICRTDR